MKYSIILIIFFVPMHFYAQSNNIAKPYFQQKVDSEIDVTLIDSINTLKGFIKINYTNNSKDTLHIIYMHLWANAFKNDKTAYNKQEVRNGHTTFYYSDDKGKGYMKDLAFTVDGKPVNVSEANGQIDVAILDLPMALLPGQTIKIATPFTEKIPKCFSRLGHGSHNDYQIVQWYPKPAVYDNNGWHPMPYLDQGEFFGEFGKFIVNITVPQNYIVAATGVLQTESEVQWLATKTLQKDYLTVVELEELKQKKIPSSTENKTIQFVQDSVHDFAWFADKRFIIEKSSVVINNKNVASYIYYLPSHYKQWHGACNVINQTLTYFSEHVGAYPYAHATAIDGPLSASGGMEYPMITTIGKQFSKNYLHDVLIHEVGHNWFQGILGTNERDFAFMDEGFNTFYENKVANNIIQNLPDSISNQYEEIENYIPSSLTLNAQSGKDQPMLTSANEFSEINYGNNAYYKPVIYFLQLEQYLGKELFEQCMKNYYTQWHHQHPNPIDLQAIFESTTKQNLNWFFVGLLSTTNAMDFAIKKVVKLDNELQVEVSNRTHTIAPVSLSVYLKDSVIYDTVLAPFEKSISVAISIYNYDKIVLDDYKKMLDINRKNNSYSINSLFHKHQFHLNYGKDANLTNKHELFLNPSIGYNNYNGLLLGFAFHNASMYQTKFRFLVMPQIGLYSKSLEGMLAMGYAWHTYKAINKVEAFVHASKFAYDATKQNLDNRIFNHCIRIVPQIKILFRNKTPKNNIVNELHMQQFLLWKNEFQDEDTIRTNLYKPTSSNYAFSFISKLQFTHANKRTMNPFSYNATIEGNQLFAKMSITGKLFANYNLPNKGLHIRVFAGKFYNFASDIYDAFQYRLAGTHTAENDYTFSNYYVGRSAFNTNLLSQQITENEGGMKLTSNLLSARIGLSDNYLFGINLKSDLPIKLKLPINIRPYVDFIAYKNTAIYTNASLQNSFASGIQLSGWQDRITINYPLFMSNDYKEYFASSYSKNERWKHQITFSILINNADLYNLWGY